MTMSESIANIYNDVESLRILKSIQYQREHKPGMTGLMSIDQKISLKALEELTGGSIIRNHPNNKLCVVRFQ